MVKRIGHKAAKTPGRRALLVLGMHRSGTSSLARVFSLRGASLPEHLLPANYGNETGYWEPESVVALNDHILDFFGVAWDDPFAASQLPPTNAFPARFAVRARQIITQEYPDSDLFVLKDPRCTLLHRFWFDVLASLNVRVCPVVVARPFEEVADSLLRRDGTSGVGAVLLYVAYGLEAAAACEAGASVVTYRQLLADWQGTTDRVAQEQGIIWPRAGVQASVEIDAFLRPAERVSRTLRLPEGLEEWANTVGDWLERAATGDKPEGGELAAIRQELIRTMGVFAPILVDRKRQLRDLARALEEANEQVQQVGALLDKAQATLRQTALERDAALAERDTALRTQQETANQLHQTEASYQQLERESVGLRDARDAVLAERDTALRSQQETADQLHQAEASYQQLERESVGLREARDEALAERDTALRVQQETADQLHQTEASYQQLERESVGLREARDAALAERDTALRVQQETADQLHQTEASYQQLERESVGLREARDAALLACREAGERLQQFQAESAQLLQSMQSERDASLRIYAETDQRLHQTEASYQQLDKECENLRQSLLESERQQDKTEAALAAIHASRSWRATAPLRSLGRFGRHFFGRNESGHLLLPAPMDAPTPASTGDVGSADDPNAVRDPSAGSALPALLSEPHFRQRRHTALRHFLVEEFGADAANDIVLRIDRYRLPVDTNMVRAATKVGCTEAEGLSWAMAIARKASHIDPEAMPDVSIIIPIYNQLPFTLACLDSLVSHQTRYKFEILVGDDASTDATARVLATPINGVRHVRHASNLGFVRNCNSTAALAQGRYVVILNNDTQVLPNWLDELIDSLEADSDIGLIGSKLIYPDGRMQECGGIVWRDGSAWNFGRLEDPRRPEFCYLRDTDYVSGASITLRRTLWQELGGFDELFAPAYAEDVDLAFRVRAIGLRTVVQPLSQLLHFEGASSGTDLAQGTKAYQVENLKKLHERWYEVLRQHRDNADHPELEKERNITQRMLFVDLVTPTPNEDAGSLVAFEMMSAFRANGFKITFIPSDNFAHVGASTRDLQRIGIEAIYHPAYSSMPSFLSTRHDSFDVILLVRYRVGEAHMQQLRQHYPSAKFIFSNCDLHYLREMREAELSGDPEALATAHDTKRREVNVIARSDVNLVHSEAELELLRMDVPDVPCVLFPLIHDPVEHCGPLSARDGICFIGGYRHAPNADGISWFVEKIWPLVIAKAPQHILYIAGSSMTDEVRALARHPNVKVVGFVDDLDTFLSKRRATIAPLRFGAGAKGKVAASLANGVPVVSTSVGAEGMQLAPGTNVLVADSENDFALAVLEILGNDPLWERLSVAGLQYAAEITSRASARKRVRSILDDLGFAR